MLLLVTWLKLELNKTYTFDLTGTVSFGDLPAEKLYELFRDGRFACEPISWILEQTFEHLTYVDRKGFDFSHPEYPYIEKKQITKGGLKFCPSSMIGTKRSVDYNEVLRHIKELDLKFFVVDITSFPIVRAALIDGESLVEHCTNKSASYPSTKAQDLFINAFES
jgi:hypothetical protein